MNDEELDDLLVEAPVELVDDVELALDAEFDPAEVNADFDDDFDDDFEEEADHGYDATGQDGNLL